MLTSACVFILTTTAVICGALYLDSIKPCKIDDGKCQGDLVETVINDIAKPGLPEIGLESIDPVNVKNMTIKILNTVEITLLDGELKGIRKCHVNKFGTKIDERHTWMEMICNLTLKTKYTVFSSSPFIHGLTGGKNISGDGNGKIRIEQLKIKFDFYFAIVKKNGEIYAKYHSNKTKYSHEFGGKVTFSADKLYIGNEESSKTLIALMNQNYQTLVSNYNKHFMDKAIKVIFKFIHKFFDNVPTRYYILDDLSSYVE